MQLKTFFSLLIVINSFSGSILAQDCNLDKDETDAFSKLHTMESTSLIGSKMNFMVHLTLRKVGTDYGWGMELIFLKHIPDAIKKGDKVLCAFEDGSVAELICDNDYYATDVRSGSAIRATFLIKGNMSEADMKKFSTSPLSKLRIIVSGETVEREAKDKQGKELQNTASCLLRAK